MVLGLVGLAVLMYGLAVVMETGTDVADDRGIHAEPFRASSIGAEIGDGGAAADRASGANRRVMGRPVLAKSRRADTVAGTALAASESMHQVMRSVAGDSRAGADQTMPSGRKNCTMAQQHRRNYMVEELQRLLEVEGMECGRAGPGGDGRPVPERCRFGGTASCASRRGGRTRSGIRSRNSATASKNLMAVWAWDQAYSDTARFVENFPDHPEGRKLLARVMRQREAYTDETANRLYEEIRSDIDRRLWRRAMTNAVKLLEVRARASPERGHSLTNPNDPRQCRDRGAPGGGVANSGADSLQAYSARRSTWRRICCGGSRIRRRRNRCKNCCRKCGNWRSGMRWKLESQIQSASTSCMYKLKSEPLAFNLHQQLVLALVTCISHGSSQIALFGSHRAVCRGTRGGIRAEIRREAKESFASGGSVWKSAHRTENALPSAAMGVHRPHGSSGIRRRENAGWE